VRRLFPLLLVACTGTRTPSVPGPKVALTFDDLPYQTARGGRPLETTPEAWRSTTDSILAALAEDGLTAGVFVNCGNTLPDDRLVDQWRAAGHAIGNHTAHHRSAAHGELDDWVADLRACDDLWPAGSSDVRWFRFPYLWRGETEDRRDAVLGALQDGGYTAVPVTVDTHDWLFEFERRKPETQASPQRQDALQQLYVDNVADALVEARAISREKLGREVPQILLLHVNDSTAQALPAILDGLERAGVQVVSVAEAMTDPLYAEPDAWAGRGSRWWLARTAPTQRPDGSPWYADRESALRAALDVL